MKPDSTPPSANGDREPEEEDPGLEHADPAHQLERGRHQHHHDARAPVRERGGGSVPSRNGARPVTLRGDERVASAHAQPDEHEEHRADEDARRSVNALSQPADATCWIAAVTPTPMPNISSTRVTTGTERVRSDGQVRHQPHEQHERDRQQHHVHAEERAPRPHVGHHAGDERAARTADAAERAPDADRERLRVVALEQRVDGDERGREAARRRDALQRAAEHHHAEGLAPRAGRRRDREPHDADRAAPAARRRGRRCDRSAAAAQRTPGWRR